ncbi:MAG: hypothetical protein QNI90_15855 [Dinoroseobacter sp.]|nr:hypothetical protein [Dinoroseobacter sp.]
MKFNFRIVCLVAVLWSCSQGLSTSVWAEDSVSASVVRISNAADNQAIGTGFFVSSRGHILTASDLMNLPSDTFWVEQWSPTEKKFDNKVEARVLMIDQRLPLAVLRIEGLHPNNPPLRCTTPPLGRKQVVKGTFADKTKSQLRSRTGSLSGDPEFGEAGRMFIDGMKDSVEAAGGPITADGVALAVAVKSLNRVWPVEGVYALPLDWAIRVLPPQSECWQDLVASLLPSASPGHNDQSSETDSDGKPRVNPFNACVSNERERALTEQDFVTASVLVSSRFGEPMSQKDVFRHTRTLRLTAPPGWEFVGSPETSKDRRSSGGIHNIGEPEYIETDGRQTEILIPVTATSDPIIEEQLEVLASARIRRIVSPELIEEIREQCRLLNSE